MGLVFLFVDGIGIGGASGDNPFTAPDLRILRPLGRGGEGEVAFGGRLVSLDANLGVPGLPQSATGQTSLLTGVNAQALLGRHLNAFPNRTLREVIAENGLLRRALPFGPVAFANAYTPRFFDPGQKIRESVTTVAARTAGLPLRTLDDLRAGRAVFHDFTNRVLVERGLDALLIEAQEAAARLGRLAASHRLLLYEHFLTDVAGHTADLQKGIESAASLDEFLYALLEGVDLESTTVLLTSDHGNLEDCSTRSHTRNPVPAFLWGRDAGRLSGRLRAITDVAPAILGVLST